VVYGEARNNFTWQFPTPFQLRLIGEKNGAFSFGGGDYLLFSSEAITPYDPPHFFSFLDVWEALVHVVQWAQVQIQEFMEMLVVASNPKVRVLSNQTVRRRNLSIDQQIR